MTTRRFNPSIDYSGPVGGGDDAHENLLNAAFLQLGTVSPPPLPAGNPGVIYLDTVSKTAWYDNGASWERWFTAT